MSLGRVALIVGLACGCFSLEELSSYRAGATALDTPTEDPAADSEASTLEAGALEASGDLVEADAGTSASATEAADPAIALEPAALEPDVAGASGCDAADEFVGLDPDTCYRLLDTGSSWADARSSCQEWGGDLAEITTAEENVMLVERLQVDVWLGATDLPGEGGMEWNSGAPLVFTAWAEAQPDNFGGLENCLELRGGDDHWNDVPCVGPKLPLCERTSE